MTRFVVIDETGHQSIATPFDTEDEAALAVKSKIIECLNDPKHYLRHEDVWLPLDSVSNAEISELLSEIFIEVEGEVGVWSNYSSGDRWSVSGRMPEDEEFGNTDTKYYRTAGVPSGTPVTVSLEP